MKISDKDLNYLEGRMFSDYYNFKVTNSNMNLDREDYIAELVQGKKVIHLGFADHIENVDRKIKNGTWFHSILCDASERCLGVDINEETVEYIKNKYDMKDVLCGDITESGLEVIKEECWDYLILGEVLEHIENPIGFLKSIQEAYGPYFKYILITVPNAFYAGNFLNGLKGKEHINPDHKFWFTPFTIAKVITCSGYKIDEIIFANNKPEPERAITLNLKGRIVKTILTRLYKKQETFKQTLIAIASQV